MSINELLDIIRNATLIAALIVAIRFWRYYKNTTEHYFLHFLVYSVCTELIGYAASFFFKCDNFIFYNVFMVISFLFYVYWFQLILKNKRLVHVFTVFIIASVVYSLSTENAFTGLFHVVYAAGIVCIITLTLYYFIQAMQSEQITFFFKDQKFWIVTGLFLFYLGFLPTLLFQKYLVINAPQYRIVITCLNIILYGCYIKAFLCTTKKK